MDRQYGRMAGSLVVASAALLALAVLDWSIAGGSPLGLPYPLWLGAALIVNLGLTLAAPRRKRAVVAAFQKYLLNPVVRALVRLDVPLGWNLLETRGRRTGRPRVVPVGNGLVGTQFWIIAEHGAESAYIRNIRHDPRVRLRIRRGLRGSWVSGTATVLVDDDPWARQRWLIGWRHPLRAVNACVVRVLGTRLLTVLVDLDLEDVGTGERGRGLSRTPGRTGSHGSPSADARLACPGPATRRAIRGRCG